MKISRILASICAAGLWMAAAVPQAVATPQPSAPICSADSDVIVVVDYQELGGDTETYCAKGLADGATAADAFDAVGVRIDGSVHDGTTFACRVNGRPAADETIPIEGDEDYTEQCVNTPPTTAYWSLWHAGRDGGWTYSNAGARAQRVSPGEAIGWSFALNATVDTAPAPRVDPLASDTATATSATVDASDSSSIPTGAIIGIAAVVVLGGLFVLMFRRKPDPDKLTNRWY